MFWGRRGRREGLAHPALRGACQLLNASACLAVLDAFGERLRVGMNDVRKGLATIELPGRFQVLPGRPAVVLDVAHNPEAAAMLAQNLDAMGPYPATHAVFGMLRDKDIERMRCPPGADQRLVRGHPGRWCAGSASRDAGEGHTLDRCRSRGRAFRLAALGVRGCLQTGRRE
jgi:hypothetical protein